MSVPTKLSKTKEQLESDIHTLTREVEMLRRRPSGAMADASRHMAETLHSLQVHQEELRTQNEELRSAHDALERVSNRYRDLFEYSPVGYFIIDEHFSVVDANISGMGMLDRTKARIVSKPFLLFVHRDSRHALDNHFAMVRETGRATAELWLVPDKGEPFAVIVESVRLGDGWGSGWRCLTTAMNITDRKRAELALQESETRFRAIFEQSPLAIQIANAAGVSVMSNRAWVRLWGQGDSAFCHGESGLGRALAGEGVEVPAMHVAAPGDQGAERWVHSHAYPIRGRDAATPEAVLVHEDITERKRMEAALAERSALLGRQYQNLRVLSEIAALPSGNTAQRLAEALGLARRHLGLSLGMVSRVEGSRFTIEHHSALTEMGVEDGAVYDLPTTYCTLVMEQGDVVAIRHMVRSPYADHPCYRIYGLESYLGALIQVRGRPYGTVSFSSATPGLRDYDDGDKEFMRLLARWIGAVLEEDFIRRDLAKSNAELEQFAYVASHDLRQPLRQVSSYVSLLERRYADKLDGDAREFIAFAHDGAVRMDQLIVDLLEFSRIGRDRSPLCPVSLADVVGEAVANLQLGIEDAGGRVEVMGPLPVVKGDSSDLVRLFQNLIGNAVKYSTPERPPVVEIDAESGPMSHVVRVRDNGIGIASEYFDTIFGVFKRLHTPDKYEGTGIGLAICKKVMDQHHGRIWVESRPGEGTCFFLELPGGDPETAAYPKAP